MIESYILNKSAGRILVYNAFITFYYVIEALYRGFLGLYYLDFRQGRINYFRLILWDIIHAEYINLLTRACQGKC